MFAVTRYASLRRVRYQPTEETVNHAGTTIATLSYPSYKVTAPCRLKDNPNKVRTLKLAGDSTASTKKTAEESKREPDS
jgi:hypothetical protein